MIMGNYTQDLGRNFFGGVGDYMYDMAKNYIRSTDTMEKQGIIYTGSPESSAP